RRPAAAGKDRYLCGAAANPGTDTTRVVHRQLASGQAGADAGQNIAHSATGHSRIASRVITDRFAALANDRATSFEQQRDWKLIAKISRNSRTRHFANFEQALHFAGMRGEESRTATTPQSVDLVGQNIQPVGVDDHRLLRVLD